MQRTLSIIKPDAVKRSLTGEINSMIQKSNIKIVAQKMLILVVISYHYIHETLLLYLVLYIYIE